MLGIVDVQKLGYDVLGAQALGLPVAGLPSLGVPAWGVPSPAGRESQTEEAYRTVPEWDGNLRVDPEIHLPSPGMDVDIAYFYNANTGALNSGTNALYGYGRTISTQLTVQASSTLLYVTLTRGNGAVANYQLSGSSYVPVTSDLLNTLTTFTSAGSDYWQETTPDGRKMVYPYNKIGHLTSIAYAQDAVGNRHTFLYNAQQQLTNLQDALGRLVTYTYNVGGSYSGMLESIEDWAGRFTTFAYKNVAGNNVLLFVTGPSDCQTGYDYTTINSAPVLDRITDPNGYGTTYAYDASGRVSERTVVGVGTSLYTYPDGLMVATDPLSAVTTHVLYSDYKLLSVTDMTGTVVTFTRNAQGQEISRQERNGALWTTTYDSAGNPTAKVDPYGAITTISRDASNNPTTIQYADGSMVTMVWAYPGSAFTATNHRLYAVVDQLGHTTSYSYNTLGQLTQIKDALGQNTLYGYDSVGNLQSVTDPLGRITTYGYDLAGNPISRLDPLGHLSQMGYDAQNRPVTLTDALGFVTTLAYDGVGNLTVQIDALGNRTDWTYNVWDKPALIKDALGFYTTISYDAAGRPTTFIDALGHTTKSHYNGAGRLTGSVDALGRISTILYNSLGLPRATTDALGYRTTVSYDLASRPETVMDELGFISTIVYDVMGRATTLIDALGRQTRQVYDLAGRLIATVDALGYRTTIAYDAINRPVTFTDALGYRSTVVYGASGLVSATVDALGNRTSYVYDAANRRIGTQDALGFRNTFSYDAVGRLVSMTDFDTQITTLIYDAVGRPTTIMDAQGNTSGTVYDAVGRVIATVDGLGYRNTIVYDAVGRPTTIIDAAGRITTNVYDIADQRIATQDARGYFTTLSYDAVGQLTTVLDARNQTSVLRYDGRGALLERQNQLGKILTYVYDAVGNVVQRTDARNQVTNYGYDASDRLTTVLYDSGLRVTYAYEARGLVTLMRDVSGVYTMSYDALGRLRDVKDSAGAVLTSTYDAIGRRTGLQEAGNVLTTYNYSTGALSAARRQFYLYGPNGETLYEQLDELGRPEITNLASATPEQRQRSYYDAAGRMYRRGVYKTVPTVNISDYNGVLNAVGNFTKITELDGTITSYTYDSSDQLLSEWRGGTNAYRATYTYDGIGNRVTKADGAVLTTYAYNAANQLTTEKTGAAIITYSYDGNGNQRVKTEAGNVLTTYTWDEENCLTNVARPDGTLSTYTYSADGLRRKREETGSSLLEVWDGSQLLQERNATTKAEVTRYLLQNSDYSGLKMQRKASDGVSRLFAYDVQGSTRMLLNSVGTIDGSFLYRAFGENITQSGQDSLFRFGGMYGYEWDESSRMWVKARHLDGRNARWLSPDPIGFAGGDVNLTRYVGNNPLNSVDPDGLYEPGGHMFDWTVKPEPSRPTALIGVGYTAQPSNLPWWDDLVGKSEPTEANEAEINEATAYLTSHGYNVIVDRHLTLTNFNAAVKNPNLKAFFFIGHADDGSKLGLLNKGLPIFYVNEGEAFTAVAASAFARALGKRKFAWVTMHSCWSNSPMRSDLKKALLTPGGSWWGSKGTYAIDAHTDTISPQMRIRGAGLWNNFAK